MLIADKEFYVFQKKLKNMLTRILKRVILYKLTREARAWKSVTTRWIIRVIAQGFCCKTILLQDTYWLSTDTKWFLPRTRRDETPDRSVHNLVRWPRKSRSNKVIDKKNECGVLWKLNNAIVKSCTHDLKPDDGTTFKSSKHTKFVWHNPRAF